MLTGREEQQSKKALLIGILIGNVINLNALPTINATTNNTIIHVQPTTKDNKFNYFKKVILFFAKTKIRRR
jgi:hypothetical protein